MVFHPFSYMSKQEKELLTSLLKERQIKYIDLDNLENCLTALPKYQIAPWDGHPTKLLNTIIIDAITKKLIFSI